jgi:hypothetical protein
MVTAEPPKELANVATLEPEVEATTLELSEEVLQKVAEKEVTTTLEVSDKLVDKMVEKEGAVVLHEVSQEVVAEKLVNLGPPEEETKQEGETDGEYLIPVAKGSSHNGSDVSEEELEEFLMHDDIIKIHCVQEHGRQQKKKAGAPPL